MSTNYSGSASTDPQNQSCSSSPNPNSNEPASNFECNICFELAQDPVVTLCGHLFCWPCLYKWIRVQTRSDCPVCKALIEEQKLVPLYGRGKNHSDPRSKPLNGSGSEIPHRPAGQRPPTAPQPDPNQFHNPNANPWFFGGVPMNNGRFGYTFSFFGGFPMLGVQMNGLSFGAGNRFNHDGFANPVREGEQRDVQQSQDQFLSTLLLLVGFFVIASLLFS